MLKAQTQPSKPSYMNMCVGYGLDGLIINLIKWLSTLLFLSKESILFLLMNVMYVAKACHSMRSTRIQSSTAPILTFNWILQCCTVLLRQRFEKSDVIKSIWCNLNQMHWSELISDPSFRVGWCFQFPRGKKMWCRLCQNACLFMYLESWWFYLYVIQ